MLDFGPLYRAGDSSGDHHREPPRVGTGSYGVLEPQVDADGNDIGGIRSAFLQAPIGTYTGWNLGRKDRFENGLCNLQGSFIPFAATRAERLAAGDRGSRSRSAIRPSRPISRVREAAADLVAKRYLLPEDAGLLVERARERGSGRRREGGAGYSSFTNQRCAYGLSLKRSTSRYPAYPV